MLLKKKPVKKPAKKPAKKKAEGSPDLSWSMERLNAFLMQAMVEAPAYWNEDQDGPYEARVGVLEAKETAVDFGEFDDMPGCCAFSVLCDLNDLFAYSRDYVEDVWRAVICFRLKQTCSGPNILATTIPSMSRISEQLKAIGFVEIDQTRNANTGNMVTMWKASIGRYESR